VVVLLLSRGDIIREFESLPVDVVLLADGMPSDEVEMLAIAKRIVAEYTPSAVIANSLVTYPAVAPFASLSVPVALAIHEFAPPAHSPASSVAAITSAIKVSTGVAYSSRAVRESFDSAFGSELLANAVLLRQGAYTRPPVSGASDSTGAIEALPTIGIFEQDRIILGIGSVNARKGVEFFVQTAMFARDQGLPDDVQFVWLGARDPGTGIDYEELLARQVKLAGLGGRVHFAGEVDDVDAYYRRAAVVFVPSLMDSLPNSALDALAQGIPVVTFEGAGGIAEILGGGESSVLVVPYVDTHEAAARLVNLVTDPDEHSRQSAAALAVIAATCLPMPEYSQALLELAAKRDTAPLQTRD
jgi:glycosyltransferase involved in cell wall biosynthesis